MTPTPVTYTVQPGDTLSGISLQFYGVYHLYKMIYGVNSDKIADMDHVEPGITLTLPPAPAFMTHTVEKGQTLSRIAKYWTGDANRWREIFDANTDQLSDPNKIEVGQVLKIPVTPLQPATS